MIDRDSLEFTTALALGAAFGAGVALLFRPERTARQRVERRTRPSRRRLLAEARGLGDLASSGAAGVGRLTHEARSLGGELGAVLREEGVELLRESGRGFLRILTRGRDGSPRGRGPARRNGKG